ncbi:MAG: hypothetical protein R2706_10955 [Acidimicrobiales bacterium]
MAPTLRAFLDAEADRKFKHQPPAFEVHYQPISRLAGANVIGYEALLRARVGDDVIDTESVFRRAERAIGSENSINSLERLRFAASGHG